MADNPSAGLWPVQLKIALAVIASMALADRAHAGDQVLQEFNEPGVADTPTAGDAVRMIARSQIVKRDESGASPKVVMFVDLHTENSAMMDNATGCVKVSLMKGGNPVSSYLTCTPRNPGRGFRPATVRDQHAEYQLPLQFDFDGLGFLFFNNDHRGQEIFNIDNVGKVVGVALQVVQIIKSLRS